MKKKITTILFGFLLIASSYIANAQVNINFTSTADIATGTGWSYVGTNAANTTIVNSDYLAMTAVNSLTSPFALNDYCTPVYQPTGGIAFGTDRFIAIKSSNSSIGVKLTNKVGAVYIGGSVYSATLPIAPVPGTKFYIHLFRISDFTGGTLPSAGALTCSRMELSTQGGNPGVNAANPTVYIDWIKSFTTEALMTQFAADNSKFDIDFKAADAINNSFNSWVSNATTINDVPALSADSEYMQFTPKAGATGLPATTSVRYQTTTVGISWLWDMSTAKVVVMRANCTSTPGIGIWAASLTPSGSFDSGIAAQASPQTVPGTTDKVYVYVLPAGLTGVSGPQRFNNFKINVPTQLAGYVAKVDFIKTFVDLASANAYITSYIASFITNWTGTASTSWTNPSNWSNGVPNQYSSITIPSGGNQPTITTDVQVRALTINPGAALSITGANLTVTGTITNNGTITNTGNLILKSTASGTASLLSGSSVANVTQQRYLTSNQRGWRLLSNPLASTTFNALAAASGITIGTNFTGEYIPSSNTWTSTDGTATMTTQKAYKVFITGLSGQSPAYTTGPSNVTLVNKGSADNTAPASINTIAGQFYLVSNPYTAPVSVAGILSASTGLSTTVSYYNPTNGSTGVKVKAGGYDTITVSGVAGSVTDLVIPPMGTVFVVASSDGTINVPKTAIYTGTTLQSGTFNHKSAQTTLAATNTLKIEVRSGGVYYDTLALQFRTVGEAGSNVNFGKLPNTILDLYSFAGSQKMAVSEVELIEQTIPLGITSTLKKNYTFSLVENSIPTGFEAILEDKLLNTSTVLKLGTTYDFTIDSTPASQGDARFAINLKATGSLSLHDAVLDSKFQLWPNPARSQFNILNGQDQKDGPSTIEISNFDGQMIHTYKSNPGTTTTIQTKGLASGVYIIKITNNGAKTTKKLILQ